MEDKLKDAFSQLEAVLKGAPEKIKELQATAMMNKPKSSRRVIVDGCEVIATISEANNITLEFIVKEQAEIYFNGLELK